MVYLPFMARSGIWTPPPVARPRGLRIARLFGIDVVLDASWFLIIVLVTLSIHSQFELRFEESVSARVLWTSAVLEGLLFFGSVLFHEFSHSLVARRLGVEVHTITLFIFGGVSSLKDEPARAKDELFISGVGPLSSLVLGALTGLLSLIFPDGSFPRYFFHWLSVTNVVLAVFNLLPGFPLDGGRVLRALVWKVSGSMNRGTRVAGLTGCAIGYGLITLGTLLVLFDRGFFNGLWFMLIGWFLLNAAQTSLLDLKTRDLLSHHEVRQVMRSDCPAVPGSLPLAVFVGQVLLRTAERCFTVTEEEDPKGLLTLRDIRAVPRKRWEELKLRDVMVPFERMRHVSVSDTLLTAMETMNRDHLQQLAVTEDRALVGVVTREGIQRALEFGLEWGRVPAGP